MKAEWTPESTYVPVTLCGGSDLHQPLGNLQVRVSREVSSAVDLTGHVTIWGKGAQIIEITFETAAANVSQPSLRGRGSLRITAPDGSTALFSPAFLTSRSRGPLAGATEAWSYTCTAPLALVSTSDFAGIFVTDSRGVFKIDSRGYFAIRQFQ